MAKPNKRRVEARTPGGGGRVTPTGGGRATAPVHRPTSGAATSGRYTAPIPREFRVSPWFVPAAMFTLLAFGTAVIVLNYVELLPTWGFLPDGTSNVWLLVGLLAILAGIIVATQWH